MTRKNKGWIAAATVTVGIAAAWVMLRPSRGGAAVEPDFGQSAVEIVAPGVIESTSDQVALAFDAAGRVVDILVDEGDQVTAGQLVGRLDDRLARARVAQAEAALAAAEARRDLAERGSRPAEIAAAAAEARAAQARAWERGLAAERAERLIASDSAPISQAAVDADRSAADAATAQADAAGARHELIKQGSRSEHRREARAAVAAAAAELEQARVLLSQTELRAPRAGVILRRYIEPGEQVTTVPPTVVLTMADTSALQLRAEVDESDVGRITTGQRGWARADAHGDRRFSGHIVRIAGELGRKTVRTDDPRARIDTRILEVLFVLDDPTSLPLGLRMDLHLE